jgi:chemotaxis family two-component system sensor kinase Cph1
MSATNTPYGDCKNAPLHDIGTVKASGVLVAVHAKSQLIEYCSANSAELLGIEATTLLGRTGDEWLSDRWPGLQSLASLEGSLEWQQFPGSEPLVVIGHRWGEHQIFEFERAATSHLLWWTSQTRIRFLQQLTSSRTAEQCRELLVSWIFEHSGYDRVMMYRFLPAWHGEVVEERYRPGVGGFLGLRFPATDIPPNARRLFTLNWQRTIVDVDAGTSLMLSRSEDAPPLDMTYATLRSAHPAHIQYLKNMGVQATLTLSLVVNGKLWGLIAAHHLSPRIISIEDRLAFEEMARLVSLHLTNLVGLTLQNTQSQMRQELSRLQGAMSTSPDNVKLALSLNLGTVRHTFNAGGAWLRFEGEDAFAGLVPDTLALAPLRDFLELFPREEVSHYDVLPEVLHPHRALSANASGVLFIPLSSADFIALLRPEVIQTVNWAGKPELDNVSVPAERPLTPRNSFALWSQLLRNTSEPWTDIEIEFAAKLRTDIQVFISTARLEQIALHDPLTGLANRLLFERRLQQEVRNSMTRSSVFAVYMIDLDKFKEVNDTFGHAAGDQVLRQVAARLTGMLRKEDTVARLGGDEFAILQTLRDKTAAVATAERIVQLVCQPCQFMGKDLVEIGASVGVSICPSDTVEESELLECADLALYQVKRSGKSAYSMYAPTMRVGESRSTNADMVSQGLRDNEFGLKYQTIIDARSGKLRGLEAFLRWVQPGRPELAASEFMPLVEQKRLGPAVTEWVLDAVFRQYQQWLREGLPMVPIAINIGNVEFASQDLLGEIEKLGARYETGWHWLRLDIKEDALVEDVGHAIRKLGKLRDAGVGVNLDNFGRGFVPLGSLTQLPFRGIKLDGMLFEPGSDRQYFNALFTIVQSIARVFSAQLTVTKIETLEMREALANHNVDLLQGYALSRPEGAAQAAEWLRKAEEH